jgi:hypothetical protein
MPDMASNIDTIETILGKLHATGLGFKFER